MRTSPCTYLAAVFICFGTLDNITVVVHTRSEICMRKAPFHLLLIFSFAFQMSQTSSVSSRVMAIENEEVQIMINGTFFSQARVFIFLPWLTAHIIPSLSLILKAQFFDILLLSTVYAVCVVHHATPQREAHSVVKAESANLRTAQQMLMWAM